MNFSLNNVAGSPASTLTGLATGAAAFAALSQMIGGQAGTIIGGVTAAIIVVLSSLGSTKPPTQ